MKTQNRNGVLGLETAKQVMVTFLVLAVTGIAILLSLTALNTGVGSAIDTSTKIVHEYNETPAWINITGYELAEVNSSNSAYVITELWNTTTDVLIVSTDYSVNTSGWLFNDSVSEYSTNSYDVNVSYYYTYTYDSGKTDQIVGNVSAGLVTFFGSTGTIFSILIVVVIILAISIIIWAVGRFGSKVDGTINL